MRKGTSVLLVKGTSHIRMKETRAKTTMITSASSDVGRLKFIRVNMPDENLTLSVESNKASSSQFASEALPGIRTHWAGQALSLWS